MELSGETLTEELKFIILVRDRLLKFSIFRVMLGGLGFAIANVGMRATSGSGGGAG